MSLGRIPRRHAVNLAAHTQDRDRTTAVAARRAAAAVDRHLTGIVEAHRPTAAEATANHTRVRAPAPTIAREAARTLLVRFGLLSALDDKIASRVLTGTSR
jgi:hypothetical protein